MTFNNIPTVDLNQYLHGSESDRKAFAKQLGETFSGIGFAIVANHGVSDELIANAYNAFQAFFALPDDIKSKYEIEGIAGQRGYTGKGKEHAKGRNTGDLKEFFHVGQEVTDGDPIKSEYPDNVPVAEVPQLAEYGFALYRSLEFAGVNLLRAIADYLDLPNHYFDDKVHNGNSILRPIHYFPIENPDEIPADAVRAAEHEDINLITLLIGASADGLEVKKADGTWLAAKPKPNEIVINVGDMLQRLTNNHLKSTTHRVVNPPRELMHLPRFSVPFFLHPKANVSLACLASCISAENPKAYPDCTAGEYLNERLGEIGLKK